MRKVWQRVVPFVVLSMLSCAGFAQAPAQSDTAAAQKRSDQHFRIDPAQSDIHWLVYKDGALAHFGHNHVIAAGKLTGDVYVAPELAQSRFKIKLPVSGFVIDNPALRAQAGEGFEKQPSDDDIKGTRHNMLGDEVLKAEQFPVVIVRGTGPIGTQGQQQLHLDIQILGHTVAITVPTQVEINGDTLEAKGKFALKQTTLGMEPFSIALGALKVADKMNFVYDVVAHRVP